MRSLVEEFKAIFNVPDVGTIIKKNYGNKTGFYYYVVNDKEDFANSHYSYILGQNMFYWASDKIVISTIFVKPPFWYWLKCKLLK